MCASRVAGLTGAQLGSITKGNGSYIIEKKEKEITERKEKERGLRLYESGISGGSK